VPNSKAIVYTILIVPYRNIDIKIIISNCDRFIVMDCKGYEGVGIYYTTPAAYNAIVQVNLCFVKGFQKINQKTSKSLTNVV